ncbi:gamma carbonic anhydrase family protein, partial [Lysinibacillus sp. D4B1_S16]|uniref:gamma carbonic anhydrase family protein n=1 Tax=Lysinibacillus sp. D4B1_S16 TaxID=2941231 RepID=UPI0037C6EA45
MIFPFKDKTPKIDPSVFIADNATVTGDVTIGAETTIWFNTVIRADVSPTIIRYAVSIQD